MLYQAIFIDKKSEKHGSKKQRNSRECCCEFERSALNGMARNQKKQKIRIAYKWIQLPLIHASHSGKN